MGVLQIVLYWLWGNVLCAGSMSFSALCTQARPAVLIAVIWVIMSGFGANLVLTQFIEQGPSVAATVLQIIPSMSLFRGEILKNPGQQLFVSHPLHAAILTRILLSCDELDISPLIWSQDKYRVLHCIKPCT